METTFYLSRLSASPQDADYPFQPPAGPYPVRVDLRMWDSPVEDQLSIGSCVANALVAAFELILKRAGRYMPGAGDLARLYLYYYARYLDNLQEVDSGAVPRSGCKAANKFGVCFEATYPYQVARVLDAPTDAAKAEGLQMRLTRYERIAVDRDNLHAARDAIKGALVLGAPVTIAMRVYEWVRHISGPLSVHYKQPGAGNPLVDPMFAEIGNHQMLIVGYDDSFPGGGAFIVKNSWGGDWGDGGYWAMSYAYLRDAFELWVVRGFAGAGDVAPGDEAPLPFEVVRNARQWAVDHGLGYWEGMNFVYAPRPDLGHFVMGGGARAAGIPVTQLPDVLRMPPGAVTSFLAESANQPLINTYAADFAR